MVDVATLALEARTEGLVKAEAALDRVTAAAIKTDAAADRMTAGAGRADAAVGNMGRSAGAAKAGFQNLGYQVQDFAVQVGSGTSASQALGQQLPQLLSGFGLLGVALGTFAAVAAPIAGALFNMGEKAVSLDDAIDNLSGSLGSYQEFTERARQSTVELAEEFGGFSEQIRSLSEFMADVSLDQSLDDATAAIEPLKGGLSEVERLMGLVAERQSIINGLAVNTEPWLQAKEAVAVFQDSLDQSLSSLGLNEDQARALLGAINDLSLATGTDDIAAAALRANEEMQKIRDVTGTLPAPLRDAAIALDQMATRAAAGANASGDAAIKVSSLRDRLNAAQAAGSLVMRGLYGARDGAVALVDAAPGGGWLSGAIGDASTLASTLWDAVAAKAAALGGGASRPSIPGGLDAVASGDVRLGGVNGWRRYVDPTIKFGGVGSSGGGGGGGSSGGGGGGGASDGFQAKLDALMEGLQTERDTTDAWYAESMTILEDRRAMELLGAKGHADALLAIEAELQKRKAEVRDADLGHYESFFGAMAGALQSGGGKMLAISKGFALAEAAVSIWRGAAKALELPFPASLAAWGQVIATGAKALSGIKSASFGGGSVGGGGGAVGSSQVTAPSAPDRTIRVNIEGDGVFADMLRSSIRTISDALGEERNIGGFVVA